MTQNEITHIGFLIFPGFPMACLTSMIEPLRAANEIAGRAVFRWTLIAERAGQVPSSAEIGFEAQQTLAECNDLDILLLLSSPTASFRASVKSNGALRSLARHGITLGGISGGVFPLVRSGVMEGHRVSVHWCYEAAFRAEFPNVDAVDDVIVAGRRRYTISGAAAAFDVALQLIEQRLDLGVAQEVACWFQHPRMRGSGVRQSVPVLKPSGIEEDLPPVVAQSIALFAQHLSEPISVADVATRVGVTARQIERAFKKATGQSPTQYYRAMRMNAARQLVMYTKDAIADIAGAVGYASPNPLSIHYRAAFGCTPTEDRRQINRFRVEGNVPIPSV